MDYYFFNYISTILLVIGFLAIVTEMFVIVSKYFQYENVKVKSYIIIIIGIVLLVSSFLTNNKCQNILNEKVNEGYVVYLDGQTVDARTISFAQYNVSINDADKTICLSQKERRNYIPVIFPR